MPLSTPAKVTIGVLAGVATITGVVAVARAGGKDDDEEKPAGGGMRRDDGTRPAEPERLLVAVDMQNLVPLNGGELEAFPINVGDKNLIRFSKEQAAEFSAGRVIAKAVVGKVVAGEFTQGKTWEFSTPSFEVAHIDTILRFDADAQALSFVVDRAGVYVLVLSDQDGAEIWDDMLFLATSKPETAAA